VNPNDPNQPQPQVPTPNLLGDPKKKKLIILIAAIVGGLVVLGVIALVVIGLLFPSKTDYRDAATQFNAVSAAYSDLNSNASKLQYDVSGSTTDTEFTNDSDAVTKSLQTFQDANKKLAGMKAVKVGDGQKLYATYQEK
jgi:outer membrane murein-binding lipoprotein Lpp